MKTNYLFPNKYKTIGWCLYVPFFILGVMLMLQIGVDDDLVRIPWFALSCSNILSPLECFVPMKEVGFMYEIVIIGLILSLLFIAFAREKDEDEFTISLRMKSMIWAFKVDAVFLIIGTLFVFGLAYLDFLFIFIFLIFMLYIVRFYYELYKMRRANDEE